MTSKSYSLGYAISLMPHQLILLDASTPYCQSSPALAGTTGGENLSHSIA